MDDVILDGLRETRGARHTVESATAVFVKFPALAQQRYVSLRHLYFAISFLADSSSLYAMLIWASYFAVMRNSLNLIRLFIRVHVNLIIVQHI